MPKSHLLPNPLDRLGVGGVKPHRRSCRVGQGVAVIEAVRTDTLQTALFALSRWHSPYGVLAACAQ